jgi:hypothetical protein
VREQSVKNTLGILLIVSHFLIVTLVIILYTIDAFLFEEMTTTVALIVPMFAIYTTAIVKNIIEHRNDNQTDSKNVSSSFAFLSFFLPVLFTVLVMTVVLLRAFNKAFDNFEQFKIMLGIVETVFAIYVGQIIGSLFGKEQSPKIQI